MFAIRRIKKKKSHSCLQYNCTVSYIVHFLESFRCHSRSIESDLTYVICVGGGGWVGGGGSRPVIFAAAYAFCAMVGYHYQSRSLDVFRELLAMSFRGTEIPGMGGDVPNAPLSLPE